MFTPFYNRIIRKMVVAFGSLFNEITLIRYNKENTEEFERVKVPLIYSPKEKFITRLFADPDLTRSVNTILPRLAFEITGYSYDASRKSITTLKSFGAGADSRSIKTQNIGVPYDMEFTLSLFTRNIEDGTQIIEQILPYFTPDFTVTINFVDGIPETTKDVPFILNSVDNSIEYEGDFTATRLIIWNLSFTAKTYFFGPISTGKIIVGQYHSSNGNPVLDANGKQIGGVKVNLYQELFNRQLQELELNPGGFGSFRDNETIRVANSSIFGTVQSWSSNTRTLFTKDWNGTVRAGNSLIGDTSGAIWTINNINGTYIKISNVHVVQDPLTATVDDDYGFSTTISEYPYAE